VLIIFWFVGARIAEEMNVDEKKKRQRQRQHSRFSMKVDRIQQPPGADAHTRAFYDYDF